MIKKPKKKLNDHPKIMTPVQRLNYIEENLDTKHYLNCPYTHDVRLNRNTEKKQLVSDVFVTNDNTELLPVLNKKDDTTLQPYQYYDHKLPRKKNNKLLTQIKNNRFKRNNRKKTEKFKPNNSFS